MLGFWICGFAFSSAASGRSPPSTARTSSTRWSRSTLFGKPFEVLGYKGFFLTGAANDASVLTLFLFQMVFMDTAATIPTGAMAERWKFSAFVRLRLLPVDAHLPGLRLLGLGRRLAGRPRRQLRPGQRARRLRRLVASCT